MNKDLITIIPFDQGTDLHDTGTMTTIDETQSIGSSVEFRDAAINESWDWTSVQRRLRTRATGNGSGANRDNRRTTAAQLFPKFTHLNIGVVDEPGLELALSQQQQQRRRTTQHLQQDESWLNGLWRWWNERAINARLVQYDEDERNTFVQQRLVRIATIWGDECTKVGLSQLMLCGRTMTLLQQEDPLAQALRRKCGQRMAEWVAMYAHCAEQQRVGKKKKKDDQIGKKMASPGTTGLLKNEALDRAARADVDDKLVGNALDDPLMGWFRQRQDVSGRMLARIQQLAASISQQVAWSFLIEPGRPKTDLSRFYAEFDVLENFFDKVELSAEECSQKAFDANCLFKVRNRKLICVDWSRVRLTVAAELTQEGIGHTTGATTTRPKPIDLFDDFDCPRPSVRAETNHGDFINASRVVGGPLLNTFILTQAPLAHTMADFWRMVWQERSEWIFQLCEATNDPADSGGLPVGMFDQLTRTHCPFYWPRFEGDVLRFGRLHVRNVGIDKATDPLFTITQLELWVEEEEDGNDMNAAEVAGPSSRAATATTRAKKLSHHRLQHWQWDWRSYTDFHWPFRVLLRARHSKRPTILMCADGCGRSGTLALIEIFLMQLLRGAVSFENPMLTAAVFLRLQRRHAVANHQQWLFAYRTVLHWLQPFVISWYHRLVLGFTFTSHGFCAKYAEIAQDYAHRKNLLN